MRSMPASNSSGVSTTAARGGGSARATSDRHAATRAATRGHSSCSSHARSSSVANAARAIAGRSTIPLGATSDPQRATTASRTSSVPYSSWTTASVDSVAAPSSASAFSAVDLPAPRPPVSPTNGMTAGSGSYSAAAASSPGATSSSATTGSTGSSAATGSSVATGSAGSSTATGSTASTGSTALGPASPEPPAKTSSLRPSSGTSSRSPAV